MKPKLHFTAPHYWINDPNGLIEYQGKYHVFYQHFPYAPFWGTMHWGHAVTEDFVHFEHLPFALYPSAYYDRNGCFSGSAIEKDGKLYLYYTAIRYAKENPDYVHIQYTDDDLIASQALLISQDGYRFDNQKDKQDIIGPIVNDQIGDFRHTRDPKVWITQNGKIAMVLGSRLPTEKGYAGKVIFFDSEDGIHFTYRQEYSDPTIGDMWECPDVFSINDQWFMTFSPMNIDQPPKPTQNAYYMPITFNEDNYEIKDHQDYQYLDYGLDLYAPQTFVNKKGQRLMLAWLRMFETVDDEDWVGMYIMPRVLSEKDGHLYQNVLPSLKALFKEEVKTLSFDEPFSLHLKMHEDSHINLGGYQLYIQDDCLYADRENVCQKDVYALAHTPPLNHLYDLEIYYDHHVFEIFINDGYYVLSQIVDQLTDDYDFTHVEQLKIYKQ